MERPAPRPDAVFMLTEQTMTELPGNVSVPTYDRAAISPAVAHIGVGGFHRAHQGVYFDRLAELGVSRDWGVVGISLHHHEVGDALAAQDCLYTVVSRGGQSDEIRVVGALQRFMFAPDQREEVFAFLADPGTRLVTLTITGDGYNVDLDSGELDADAPEIGADLAHPERPCTAAGHLVEALRRRRAAGIAPFTVLSCDNVPGNGRVARAAVTGLARLRDPRLADWIEQHVAFPCSMVDRITPETNQDTRGLVVREFGVADRSPVVTESFSQWIVEDAFCNGRPPLERVGVQFVDDVTPYELMKKRLLNGSHCALGYLGMLAGHRTTDAAMDDPLLRDYIARLMREEVAPLLPAVAGVDLDDYQATLLERFANPKIGDRLSRLCRRGSTKMPAYLLPSLAEARERGRPHALLTLALAAWIRWLHGDDLHGAPVEVADARGDVLQPLALDAAADARPLLAEREIFGALGDDEAFVARVQRMVAALDRGGLAGALSAGSDADQAVAA